MSIGQDFATLLRTLASSRMVPADDRHIWEAAAEAVPRLDISDKVRMVFIHDEFDPALAVLDDFDRWLDAQRDDLDSAASALDGVRAQLAAIRRHQDLSSGSASARPLPDGNAGGESPSLPASPESAKK